MLDARLKIKLDERLVRFRELEAKLADPEIGANPNIGDIMREHGAMVKSMGQYTDYLDALEQLDEMREWQAGDDAEMKELAREEIPVLETSATELVEALVAQLVGGGADNNKNVIMEIRAGTGGDEAALFAGDLLHMYSCYAELHGWKIESVSASAGEHGGFKEVTISVQGGNVFRDLRYEGGGHRVQRVPVTETQGRIHTSAATVAVLAEVEEFEVKIKQEDLKIETCRSQGPGGQSVNTTDSAVRITHLPTGATVFIQDEKSQHKNKAKAMRVLRSRIYEIKKQEEEAARSAERRSQTGSGDRSERIRTYNFPQNRCTDHRLGQNFPLNDIIQGKLDKLIHACVEWGKQQELASA